MDRLTTEFWVGAYLRRLQHEGVPAFVNAKGDRTAGAVMVKLSTLDGKAQVYQRTVSGDGGRMWSVIFEGDDAAADASLSRQRRIDPDLWIIEIEDKEARHLLDTPGLDR